ncbi:helix-turn-helix transcriptional regulator [Paenibacillus mesophilus]|uniref:helix-turn-helix domain-containing protein n=1 Tax=Paenibacillus mesophilus TaxID=2582849 RepID=UPI00110D5100|nr:helix-turn-helix transcriptional regulator [Paenibacillus mesophilus]TMV50050.1 helix-turn-helix transcriptional regulator [Paenibacillus mesophilus]
MVDPCKVGAIIHEYRLKKNWTQEQLGSCLGVSAQAVSKWEKGDSLPDISLLPCMAKELGFTIDYLLGNKGSLQHLLPQIEAELPKLKEEDRIDFLGQIIYSLKPRNYRQPKGREIEDTPYLSMDYRSVTCWVKQKAVLIATETYLQQSKAALAKDTDFPLNVIPADLLRLLAALIPDKLANPQDHAIPESKLRAVLPEDFDFQGTMEPCIELGFAERIRGGYRLNLKANFAMRTFSLMNLMLNGHSATSVALPAKE